MQARVSKFTKGLFLNLSKVAKTCEPGVKCRAFFMLEMMHSFEFFWK